MIWSQKKFETNAFLAPKLAFLPTKWAKMGSTGGLQGQFWVSEGPRPFGARNNAKIFGKKICPILAQKDLEKFRARGQKIDQNRPKWAK